MRGSAPSSSTASRGCGAATTCPRRWPTTSRWCGSSTTAASCASTPARPASRRCCCAPTTACACTSCTRPTTASSPPTSAGIRTRRSRMGDGFDGAEGRAAAAVAARRGADRPELRDQDRLRARHRVAARGAACASPTRVVIVWYPQLLTLESSSCRGGCEVAGAGKRGWLHARLTVQQPDAQGFGMIGSGLFIAQPALRAARLSYARSCRFWSTCSASMRRQLPARATHRLKSPRGDRTPSLTETTPRVERRRGTLLECSLHPGPPRPAMREQMKLLQRLRCSGCSRSSAAASGRLHHGAHRRPRARPDHRGRSDALHPVEQRRARPEPALRRLVAGSLRHATSPPRACRAAR